MSAIRLLLQAEAAQARRAVRSTGYRHIHLTKRPLIVCTYNLSGEAAAPLGIAYGTSVNGMKVVASAEPRNRESRFRAIHEFARDFHAYIRPHLATTTEVRSRRGGTPVEYEVAVSAPQVVVPNRATLAYLGGRLGRYLRYLDVSTTEAVPEETLWTGAHLSWLEDHSHYPGQSIFVSATQMLSDHYCTGQSAYEDENLASLLAWIENEPGGGVRRLEEAETRPPMGPVPDPEWEARLEPLVRGFSAAVSAGDSRAQAKAETAMKKQVRPPLRDAFVATAQAVEILRGIPEAAHSPERWGDDLRAWGSYCRRAQHGIPRFRTRHDALTAARKLETWSKALELLEAQKAFDDPLIMAEFEAQGQCVSGIVTFADISNKEVKAGNKRATQVPLITINMMSPTRLLMGTDLVWAADPRVKGQIRQVPSGGRPGDCILAVTAGHDRGTRLPSLGTRTTFVTLEVFGGQAPDSPGEVPWTHRSGDGDFPDSSERPLTDVDPSSLDGSRDGSSDLDPQEILAMPLVGSVPLNEVPGVVL